MQQTQCQQLRTSLDQLQTDASDFDTMVDSYIKDPASQADTDFAKLATALNSKKGLIDTYQSQARELLQEWLKQAHEWNTNIAASAKFDNDQRLTLSELPPLEYSSISYFPTLIRKVNGLLDVRETSIERMDHLEEVVMLEIGPSIQSMEKLRRVRGSADLTGSHLEHLDNLVEVGSDLWLTDATKFTSARRLKRVGSRLRMQGTRVETLESLEEVGDDFRASDVIRSLPALKMVWGHFKTLSKGLTTLERLEEVGGDFDLAGSGILSADALRKVKGNIRLRDTRMESLATLTEVGGDIDIFGVQSFRNLNQLRWVGENLIIAGTAIRTLDQLEKVDGYLDLDKTPFTSAQNLTSVGLSLSIRIRDLPGFRSVFPKLKSIGHRSGDDLQSNIFVNSERVFKELRELIGKKQLEIKGQIQFDPRGPRL